ncbi:hypothetical protein BGZ54_009008 [Gamsiella multidivaricata]|nr:hypothetical protein BGZ54_009008 [Gamsiella multidivaricata]
MTELNNVLKSRQAWDTIESHPNEPIGLLFVKLFEQQQQQQRQRQRQKKVIQVTNKASSKLSDVEWSLRVNSVERTSYPTRSFKDNSGNTATMNEIFLFDVSEPFQLQMTVESSPVPTKFGTMAGLSNPQPSMLGQLELSFCLEQMEKSIRTYKLRPPTAEDSSKSSAKPDCEVVIMIGLHILEEPVLDRSWETEVLYQGFLTFMTRGSGLASWKRYWAVLEGRAVKLYDAEYQQKRDVIAVIPLVHILGVQPPDLDKVDVGANGFSMVVDPKGVDMNTLSCRADPSELDYSLYAFTDSAHLYKIWNAHLEDALDQYQENMIYQERIVKAKLARRASQSLSRHSFESSAPPSPLEMEGETLGTDLVDLKFVW